MCNIEGKLLAILVAATLCIDWLQMMKPGSTQLSETPQMYLYIDIVYVRSS